MILIACFNFNQNYQTQIWLDDQFVGMGQSACYYHNNKLLAMMESSAKPKG